MKKVLMVYPRMPETFWGFQASLKFVDKKSCFPPLGLLTVAALLPKEYEVHLIDMNVENLREEDMRAADLVFISAMMVQKASMEEVISLSRKLGKTVVLGGPYPTTSYAEIQGVDHFVLGEAEITLPLFMADLEAGRAQRVYETEKRADITKTPVPRFELIDFRKYSTALVQFSRGCPFDCEFCDIIELFGRVPRTKLPEQFLAEIDALYNLGYRAPVFIVDDNFIGNSRAVKRMLTGLVQWQEKRGFPFSFFTEASVNLADDEELLRLMVASGFDMVFLGIETPVEETLILTGKAQNTRKRLHESVRKIQGFGIEVTAGFILGFDNDPDSIFELQKEFIQSSGIPIAMVGLLAALPKTRLYRRLEAEKRIVKESAGNNTFDATLNFVPTMDKDRLIFGYEDLVCHIYKPKHYFKRCLELIERFPDKSKLQENKFRTRSTLAQARALLRSLFAQGFSRYGPEYWRFLAAVVRRKKQYFEKAITLAIQGVHLFKMSEAMERSSVRTILRKSSGGIIPSIERRMRALPALDIGATLKWVTELRLKHIPRLEARLAGAAGKHDRQIASCAEVAAKTVQDHLAKVKEQLVSKAAAEPPEILLKTLPRVWKCKKKLLKGIGREVRDSGELLLEDACAAIENLIVQAEKLLIERISREYAPSPA